MNVKIEMLLANGQWAPCGAAYYAPCEEQTVRQIAAEMRDMGYTVRVVGI